MPTASISTGPDYPSGVNVDPVAIGGGGTEMARTATNPTAAPAAKGSKPIATTMDTETSPGECQVPRGMCSAKELAVCSFFSLIYPFLFLSFPLLPHFMSFRKHCYNRRELVAEPFLAHLDCRS